MADPTEILAEARSFMRSRVVLTAIDLDLFTALEERPASAAELASRLDANARALRRLMDCLLTFGLLERSEDLYRLAEVAAPLSSAHPRTVLPMARHLSHLWENWGHLTESVRMGCNPHRDPVTRRGGKQLEDFIGAMAVVGRETAHRIAEVCDLDRFERLLDIGAGPATYTMAFLRRNPRMSATVFDLPEVIPLAERNLEEEGLLSRTALVAGDFYQDELPGGCDLALLSAIAHQNSPAQNVELFRKIREVLIPGGSLLIRDYVMDEARTDPAAGALFALNMLVCTQGGDSYTFPEMEEALKEAGFHSVKLIQSGELMDGLIEACL